MINSVLLINDVPQQENGGDMALTCFVFGIQLVLQKMRIASSDGTGIQTT